MQNQNNVLTWDDCIPVKRWVLSSTIVILFLSIISYIFTAFVRPVFLMLGNKIDAETINIDGMTAFIFTIIIFAIDIVLIIVTIKFSRKIGNTVLNKIFEKREKFISKHYKLYVDNKEIFKDVTFGKTIAYFKVLLLMFVWLFKSLVLLVYLVSIINMLSRFLAAFISPLVSCMVVPYDITKFGDPYVYFKSHSVIEGIGYVILNIKDLYFSTNPDIPIWFGSGHIGMTPFFIAFVIPLLFPPFLILTNIVLKFLSFHYKCCIKCTIFRDYDCLENEVLDDRKNFEERRKEWVDKKQHIRFDTNSQGSEEKFQVLEDKIHRIIKEKRHSSFYCSYCGQKLREVKNVIIRDKC